MVIPNTLELMYQNFLQGANMTSIQHGPTSSLAQNRSTH